MEFVIGNEKRFAEFISNLDAKDKVAIIAHNDGDGLCSALIASKVIGNVDSINFLGYSYGMLKPYVSKFKDLKINKILIVDIAVDDEFESIKELEKFADILVLDHHELRKDLNSDKTIMIKTKTKNPVSYLSYKLFSRIAKVPCWLGVIGTLSDNMHKYTEDNAEQLFEDYEFDCEKGNFREEVILLSNVLIYFRDKEFEVFNLLKDAKDISALENLSAYANKVEEEIQFFVNDFENSKESHGDIIFYEFNPSYPITSALINILSVKNRDKTLIFMTNRKGLIHISSRSQNSRHDCPALLRKGIEDIPRSTAGGHSKAAGARFPSEYLSKFKSNILQ